MWTPTKNKKYGVVIYNYDGNTKYGLSLEIGETVQILEEHGGWFRGFSTRNKSLKGIFPATYVSLKAFRIVNEGLCENVAPVEDSTVLEVVSVLREWHHIWRQLYVKRDVALFQKLQNVMRDLIDWRRQLIVGTLTQDQIHDLKICIASKIDWGNRHLGLDLVPRQESQVVDPDLLSPIELYQVHLKSLENLTRQTEQGALRRKESLRIINHHIYLCMRDFSYNFGEEVEIYFALYDASKCHFISERFLVKLAKFGQSNFVEKIHNHCTVFTDLGNADLDRDMYIVVHIFRIGRMLNDSKKSSAQSYRRPYGCAVLNICDILAGRMDNVLDDEKEFTLKIHMCNENDFYQIHDFIIKKLNNKYSVLSGHPNYGLLLSVRMLHGDLSQLKQENPLLFKGVTATHKRGFPDVIMPGDLRNDLYFTLEKGEFEKGGKSTGKNVEATLLLVDNDGHLLERCLSVGSGQENVTEYQSMVLYHNNTPRWSDHIKLAIPIEKFDSAHVRIEYRHCSTRDREKRLLGFSFIPLVDDSGTILRDGLHDLYVYKCEERAKLQDSKLYLCLPCGPKDSGATTPCTTGPQHASFPGAFQRSSRESVQVHTTLCSTKLTQNGDVLALLKWKAHPEKIQYTLQKLMYLNGEEIVKFLQDILDALFSMFSTSEGESTPHSGSVFKVLVHIFSLLEKSRYEHFKPVMDTYITGHFAAALVYKGLLSCVKHCADLVKEADQQEAIQQCFRSLEYIFKFIIQSRLLFARATGDQIEEALKSDLHSLFESFNRMLSVSNDPVILPAQLALVSSYSQLCEQLLQILPIRELVLVVRSMMDCIGPDYPPSLIHAKLKCIHRMVLSSLFSSLESRLEVLDVLCSHLNEHLFRHHELDVCSDVLCKMLSTLHCDAPEVASKEVEIVATYLLETLLVVVRYVDRTSSVTGPLVANLISLLKLMEERHYYILWEKMDHDHRRDFLARVFVVFQDLVQRSVYPPDWTVIHMVANHVILGAVQECSQLLAAHFLETFDKELWNYFFVLAVSFLTQPSLQVENFSEIKRNKTIRRYGDMRVLMGFQILSMWDKLGEQKIHFVPAMVGPFLEVTLVPEAELRRATLPIFFDMMNSEQRVSGSFKQVESELIDKLDILVSENKGDDEYRQLFNTILLERVRCSDPLWKENGVAFINSITRLLERLLDYRNVMEGEENRDKRMSCTVNLLNFYKTEINRKDMYIRYIYKLCDLHLPAENYTEAAFTLKLHADLLDWSNANLPADQRYSQQPEWKRRELLYLKIIDYFDKGKCWEEGIPLCKELANLYEKRLFDYAKLSSVLKTQARFFDNILMQLRPEPEYFRVGFYGLGFPLFLRNKVFVYRGLEYERIGAFTQRLQTEFPQAQILMKIAAPDDSIMNSDGQYIQICNVKPIPLLREELQSQEVPEKVLSYYLVNDVGKFQFDRPLQKEPVDKENEFKNLWIERTTMTSASRLPGILRWFEVVECQTEELSPVQHACESVGCMNRELRRLITHYTSDPRKSISPLSMRLQGVIEAAVNGGVAKYQEAFFNREFALQNTDKVEWISRLKTLVLEQVQILDGGLSLHGRLAPAEVQPLHRRLVDRFATMKQSIREVGSPSMVARLSGTRKGPLPSDGETRRPSIVNTPLPPIPGEVIKKSSPEPGGSNRSSSSSSSIYGHFFPAGSDDEEIYSRPQDCPDSKFASQPPPTPPLRTFFNLPPGPPPPLPSRPRSVAIPEFKQQNTDDSYALVPCPVARSRTVSPASRCPESPDEMCLVPCRSSWPESARTPSSESVAPPLPPRTLTGDKKSLLNSNDIVKPVLPRRLAKKSSSTILHDICPTDVLETPSPPPLPSKKSNPGTPHNTPVHSPNEERSFLIGDLTPS